MKKKILLLTAIAGMSYLVFSSNSGGPAHGTGGNRTGAQASVKNCGGGGCHGTGAGTTVAITVDSGTTPTTHYKPGITYKIKIHGTNTSSLPKFGFEFAAVSGIGGAQVQAGTFLAPTAPIYADPLGGLTFIEHGMALTGAPAGTYDTSFQWTAPASYVGTITLYCTLNAVNGNALADAADISGNDSVKLLTLISEGTASVIENISVSAFPNPATTNLNLQMDNATPGTYNLHIFNMNGSTVASQNIEVNGISNTTGINTSNWAAGLYNVVVEKDGSRKTLLVVKQ